MVRCMDLRVRRVYPVLIFYARDVTVCFHGSKFQVLFSHNCYPDWIRSNFIIRNHRKPFYHIAFVYNFPHAECNVPLLLPIPVLLRPERCRQHDHNVLQQNWQSYPTRPFTERLPRADYSKLLRPYESFLRKTSVCRRFLSFFWWLDGGWNPEETPNRWPMRRS